MVLSSIYAPRMCSTDLLNFLNKPNLNNLIHRHLETGNLRARIIPQKQKGIQQNPSHRVRPLLNLHLLLSNYIQHFVIECALERLQS
jgi:hypothetical protein